MDTQALVKKWILNNLESVVSYYLLFQRSVKPLAELSVVSLFFYDSDIEDLKQNLLNPRNIKRINSLNSPLNNDLRLILSATDFKGLTGKNLIANVPEFIPLDDQKALERYSYQKPEDGFDFADRKLILKERLDSKNFDAPDFYAFTHQVFYLSSFGRRKLSRLDSEYVSQQLKGIIFRANALFNSVNLVDILAEILIVASLNGNLSEVWSEEYKKTIDEFVEEYGEQKPTSKLQMLNPQNDGKDVYHTFIVLFIFLGLIDKYEK
ncbi:MAG: hypothetical protein LBM27_03100 [Lactobacillaceae bacterium]|jgi:hypothetical protein|nr:hypothetical protein [Lactobacillaceae bacterium]